MHIRFVATMKNENGEWLAKEFVHDVDGFEGKVTRAAAVRSLEQRHDGSDDLFYNVVEVSAVTKTIEI